MFNEKKRARELDAKYPPEQVAEFDLSRYFDSDLPTLKPISSFNSASKIVPRDYYKRSISGLPKTPFLKPDSDRSWQGYRRIENPDVGIITIRELDGYSYITEPELGAVLTPSFHTIEEVSHEGALVTFGDKKYIFRTPPDDNQPDYFKIIALGNVPYFTLASAMNVYEAGDVDPVDGGFELPKSKIAVKFANLTNTILNVKGIRPEITEGARLVTLPYAKIDGHDTSVRLLALDDGTTTISFNRDAASKKTLLKQRDNEIKSMTPSQFVESEEKGSISHELQWQSVSFNIVEYPDGRYAVVGDEKTNYRTIDSNEAGFTNIYREATELVKEYLYELKKSKSPTTFEKLQAKADESRFSKRAIKFLLS